MHNHNMRPFAKLGRFKATVGSRAASVLHQLATARLKLDQASDYLVGGMFSNDLNTWHHLEGGVQVIILATRSERKKETSEVCALSKDITELSSMRANEVEAFAHRVIQIKSDSAVIELADQILKYIDAELKHVEAGEKEILLLQAYEYLLQGLLDRGLTVYGSTTTIPEELRRVRKTLETNAEFERQTQELRDLMEELDELVIEDPAQDSIYLTTVDDQPQVR
jgi:hypothetical protein